MNPDGRKAHPICKVEELPPGQRKLVEIAGRSIGVFNIGGRFYALHNRCPHHAAPLCEGRLIGLASADKAYEVRWEREGEILRCPWHGWEFDVTNGKSVFMPERIRTKTYPVAVEKFDVQENQGWVVVLLP